MRFGRAPARSPDLEAREHALQPAGRRWEGPPAGAAGRALGEDWNQPDHGMPKAPFPFLEQRPSPTAKAAQSQPFPSSLKGEQGVKLSVSHGGGEGGGGN